MKRFLFAPLCLIVLGLVLSGCNFSIHAENTPPVAKASVVSSASPVVDASAVSSDTPVVNSTAVSSDTPVADASAVAPARPVTNPPVASAPAPSGFPALAPDAGMSIVYNVVGRGARTITGRFPAAPGFALHISCRGSGFISVQIGNSTLNTTSCPKLNEIGNYYVDPVPTPFYTIRVTTQGPVVWRVVVENQV